MQYSALVLVSAALVGLLALNAVAARRRTLKWCADRTPMAVDHVLVQAGLTPNQETLEQWWRIAVALGVEPEMLRPDDRLEALARLRPFSSWTYDDLDELLDNRGIGVPDRPPETVGEVLDLLLQPLGAPDE